MKVLHLTHTDINSDSRILKEMQAIANADMAFDVRGIGIKSVTSPKASANVKNIKISSIFLETRAWRFLPTSLRHFFSGVEALLKMVPKSIKFKPDIVHCHDAFALPLAALVKLFSGARLVYDAHELESQKNGQSRLSGKLTLIGERLLWRFVGTLIVVSPSIRKWYHDNIGEKRSEIILNAPVLQKKNDAYGKSYLRDKFCIPESSKIFIYIGSFSQGRGIELSVEAFTKKGISSHVVFLGYGEQKDRLLELSEEHGNLHVHDSVAHEDVVAVTKSADIGLCLIENVSLSDYLCLPNKLFEYAFSGLPVLASDFPDMSSVINRYNLGKCSDLDPASIYESIKEFEGEGELLKIDSSKLFDLSWEAQGDKLEKMYREFFA